MLDGALNNISVEVFRTRPRVVRAHNHAHLSEVDGDSKQASSSVYAEVLKSVTRAKQGTHTHTLSRHFIAEEAI